MACFSSSRIGAQQELSARSMIMDVTREGGEENMELHNNSTTTSSHQLERMFNPHTLTTTMMNQQEEHQQQQTSHALQNALREFKSILQRGDTDRTSIGNHSSRRVVNNHHESSSFVDDPKLIQSELMDCSGNERHVPAILYPTSVEQISHIVRVANTYKIPLYPVSTGNNWGYGSSQPAVHDCVIVNLSKMTKIEFDEESGVVTVEPGVTQGLLHQYLVKNNLSYLIPTTGGGPNCSLLGNALERGYGLTPHADHFAAVTSMQVVLPNGEIYTSMLENMGGSKIIDKSFKWGVGPYVDGLFTQSNFGIVTKMTIILAPKPERIETFFFGVSDLADGVQGVKTVLKQLSSNIGAINLMNQRRMMSMTVPYPKDKLTDENGILPLHVVEEISKKNNFMKWNGVGTIYGTSKVVAAVKSEVKKYLKPHIQRMIFLTPDEVNFYSELVQSLPIINTTHINHYLKTLNKSMKVMKGEPSEIALPLAYWKSKHGIPCSNTRGTTQQDGTSTLHPAKDGAGLIWYAPLLPLTTTDTARFVAMVEEVCEKYGIEPLITLTSFSDRCTDGTVPILFDKETQVERAHACLKELTERGREMGYVPYRLGIHSMADITQRNAVPSILKQIKKVVDPNGIIAPGRYGLY
ncbi:hypothetical protein C9374_014567 [Naegleria lovaniensis]|uniref:FAD-binding PCMH-type domain-containing protein n=1 Tax=Naegleria lovaniensis TaxID=51637 RepID=A0AA88GUK3_NAELO|nr:uncharacterized protein C9374_014567 [Naegleria lovaniensis]KAG2389167.1 hypothetical protein C9374_014567 [Naegleria lovaniensis]